MYRESIYKYKRKRRIKKSFYWIFVIICLVVFIYSFIQIVIWLFDTKRSEELKDMAIVNVSEKKAIEEKTENVNPPENKSDDYWDYIKMDMLSVNFDELLKKNPDTVGWIKVNGTNINYPVVQANNNDYYLYHAYDKSKNNAGWIFADFHNDMVNLSRNTIIYGHGRLNNTMFGSLKNILKSSWYDDKNNYIVKFSTLKENTLWQVFSIYSIEAEGYYITTSFKNNETYNDFLTVMKNRSIKDFNTSVNVNDKIITLSTCKDIAGKERVVLHAKLIKRELR